MLWCQWADSSLVLVDHVSVSRPMPTRFSALVPSVAIRHHHLNPRRVVKHSPSGRGPEVLLDYRRLGLIVRLTGGLSFVEPFGYRRRIPDSRDRHRPIRVTLSA